ncbi:MAG: hypothetical protein RJA22_3109 [Verrucomicrobiota bacterium]
MARFCSRPSRLRRALVRRVAGLGRAALAFLLAAPAAVTAQGPVPGAPHVIGLSPAPGTVSRLTQITFTFNEPVTNAIHNSIRVNGNGALNKPSATGGNTLTFTFPPPAWGPVRIDLSGLRDLDATPLTMTATNWLYAAVDSEPPVVAQILPAPGTPVRTLAELEVVFSEPVTGVEPGDLLLNGRPATNVTVRPGGVAVFQFPPAEPGPALATWAAGAGIRDGAAAPNAFTATNRWTWVVNTNLAYPDLVIAEICAANRTGLADETGLAADWIEIHNRGAGAADLAGWALSDDAALPGKWVFPSRMLGAGQRLVVFASGKDLRNPSGPNPFHLNFTLSAGGEFLGLFTPEGPRRLASGFAPAFPAQPADVSWGPDATGQARYFAAPTPGAPNPPGGVTNACAPVHFSVERGHFTQAFDLLLTTPTAGATIRYTTDGSEPGPSRGTVWTGPLRLSGTTVLRAAAYRADLAPSGIRTHTYLFNASGAVRSLPVLSIVTPEANLTGRQGITGIGGGAYINTVWTALTTNDYNNNVQRGIAWERPVSAELIHADGGEGFQADCGLRVQGSDYTRPRYTSTSKFSYRLYFREDYGPGRLRYPWFPTSPLQEHDVVVLRAGHGDITNPFIRDELTRRVFADAGQATPQGGFVNLFINGQYKGYYNPCERVADGTLEAWEGQAEFDRIGIASSLQSGDRTAWDAICHAFNAGVDVTQPAVLQDLAGRMDLTNFVDYVMLELYISNNDWPENNWLAARARRPGGLYRWYGWDFENGYPSGGTGVNLFTDAGALNGPSEIARFHRGLLPSAEFRLLWADRAQRHFFNGGAYSGESFTNRFNEMKTELLGVIPAMNTFILTNWVPNRRGPFFSQMLAQGLYTSNAPVLSQHGGRIARGQAVSLTAPHGGTVYYTLNGPDPREAFTGAVTPAAQVYAGPFSFTTSTVVRARTLSGSTWSALTEATFAVASLGVPLRVTEIHYNPPGGAAQEFLELLNAGPLPLRLDGFHFAEGIDYTFPIGTMLPAGGLLILANNADPAAFAARYPGVTVFGWFGGSLNNAGERLTLREAGGAIVFTVDYRDAAGWPTAADGAGPSLEILDPLGSPDDPANWRPSGAEGGTPGSLSPPSTAPAVRLNEIAAAGESGDWVELHNAGAGAVDLGHWSLTDDGDPRRFVFPAGTVLEPGGFLTVFCDTNTAAPGWHTGFALGARGECVQLHDALTQRVDAVSFGPQIAGYTLGRLGSGWGLAVPTPGAANVAAALGSATQVSINEWLANPPAGLPDWIELHNRGAQPVALQGCFLATSNGVQSIALPTFIGPRGFVQLFADEGVGPDSLDLRLPAVGGFIAFSDALAVEVERVTYGLQAEGVARGRLPDGAAAQVNFPGTASPGTSNYVDAWTGPVFNEVLARGIAGAGGDFVELCNAGATAFDLSGCSLSVDQPRAGRWVFPPGSLLGPGACLLVRAASELPSSTNAGNLNLGEAMDGDSGGAYLFNRTGQLVEFVEYGPQVPGLSIGLAGGQWRLLSTPTPGASNAAPVTLGSPAALRINEWMAAPVVGPDWFELHNLTNRPVDLSGLFLANSPASDRLTAFPVAPLSFIGGGGWTVFVADNDPEQGRHHVPFSLDAEGEGIWLAQSVTGLVTVLDTVSFGRQAEGMSAGRWPDGGAGVTAFAGGASPGSANGATNAPFVVTPPADVAGRLGSNVTLAVVAGGAPPLRYQWHFAGVPIPQATNASYTRTNLQLIHEGVYDVVVLNGQGEATASATLSVAAPPVILQAPLSQTVAPGERVTLSVSVSGHPPPFGYDWRLLTTPVVSNTSPATMDFFSFVAPLYPTQLNYRVVVRNLANPLGVVSGFATVTVAADADGDGLPDAWEAQYGLATNSAANAWADADGDGMSAQAEYVAGTDPLDAGSVFRAEGVAVGTNVTVSFVARPQRTYSVLRWTGEVMADVAASPTQRVQRVRDPGPPGASGFYRVVTPRLAPLGAR